MEAIPLFQELAIGLALASFFGLAFEDFYGRAEEARPGGIRTFPLLALAGALLYLLDPQRLIPLTGGLVCVGVWLAIYYFRRSAETNVHGEAAVGLMVPVCNVIAFLLGPSAIANPPWVSVGVTAAAVLFLTNRERLHRFAREVELPELVTAGKFLVLTGLVLPLLPNHPVSTLTNITPRQAWLALIAVSGVSYASYLLQRFVTSRHAGLMIALLGGLYSSTATAVALARQARDQAARTTEMQIGVLLSTSVMYLRILMIVSVFDVSLAARLAGPIVFLFAIGMSCAGVRYRLTSRDKRGPLEAAKPSNPLALSTAAVFAGFFVVISITTNWVRGHFGPSGLFVLAGIVGFADVDPFVLNLAEGGARDVSLSMAAAAILVAASSNNVLKASYTVFIAGYKAGARPAAALASLAALGGALAYWLV